MKFTPIFRTHWGTLLLHIQLLPSGQKSLNVVGSLDDDSHSGRPRCVTTPDIIAKMHKMFLEDSQLKVQEIAGTAGMS